MRAVPNIRQVAAVLGIAAACALAGVTLAAGWVGAGGGSESTPRPAVDEPDDAEPGASTSLVPTNRAEPVGSSADRLHPGEVPPDVEATVVAFLEVAASVTDEEPVTPWEDVATASVLDELLNQQAEYERSGWTVTGSADVISVEVVDRGSGSAPDRMTVAVCQDDSGVEVLDESGSPRSNDHARTLHLYGLVSDDANRWLVATHDFPDDPNC